jgi:hypothetical protein
MQEKLAEGHKLSGNTRNARNTRNTRNTRDTRDTKNTAGWNGSQRIFELPGILLYHDVSSIASVFFAFLVFLVFPARNLCLTTLIAHSN